MEYSVHVTSPADDTSGWHYLCLADALAADSSHATLDLPAHSITAQNFRGMIAAFWNVCSHRSIQMRPAGLGHGPLRCPYHGWSYDAAGIPVGIPDNELFYDLDRAARCGLALKPAVAYRCGALLFVSATGTNRLADFLGPAFDELASIELKETWTVARHRRRVASSGGGPEGLSLDVRDGWCLIQSSAPVGGSAVDSTVQLVHAERPPIADAPPEFRQTIAAYESRHVPAHS